jgi:hypothetical protein
MSFCAIYPRLVHEHTHAHKQVLQIVSYYKFQTERHTQVQILSR